MKKVYFLLSICAVVLSACKNSLEPQNNNFLKDQEVTLGVYMSNNTQAQSSPRKIDGFVLGNKDENGNYMNNEYGDIAFQWNRGDNIQVVMGTESAFFRMLEDQSSFGDEEDIKVDNTEAYFRGKMPADGDAFKVVYGPAQVPVKQYYHLDGIAKNTMRFESSENCKLGEAIELSPVWCAFRFMLTTTISIPQEISTNRENYTVNAVMDGLKITAKGEATGTKTYDYVMNKKFESFGESGVSLPVVIVLPPDEYTEVSVLPVVGSQCVAYQNSDKSTPKYVGYAGADAATFKFQHKTTGTVGEQEVEVSVSGATFEGGNYYYSTKVANATIVFKETTSKD
ncbi:MAG: hypothetical protein MJZ64_05635 [Paludibacteraceae bacterium]|nr:hypothetical protein [Paludibacteraceae bacterium]